MLGKDSATLSVRSKRCQWGVLQSRSPCFALQHTSAASGSAEGGHARDASTAALAAEENRRHTIHTYICFAASCTCHGEHGSSIHCSNHITHVKIAILSISPDRGLCASPLVLAH